MFIPTIHPWYSDWSRRRPRAGGVKVIASIGGPVIPLEMLRQQVELVAIDGDSDAEAHPDDALLLAYLEAAVEYAEDFTGLSISLKTLELALDGFPWSYSTLSGVGRGIEIPRPPLVRIDSFLADAGSEGELDEGDDFELDDFRSPAYLMPVGSWPTMTRATNAIRIRYTAGYMPVEGSDSDFSASDYAGAAALPSVIRQALLLLVGHFYANREDSIDKALSTIPHGFHDLLRARRVLLGMA